MSSNPPGTFGKLDLPRSAGCCAGQAAGCGCSFLGGWVLALVLSSLLTSLVGSSSGGSFILSALIFFTSLLVGAVLSFLVGRWFPIFKKKAG